MSFFKKIAGGGTKKKTSGRENVPVSTTSVRTVETSNVPSHNVQAEQRIGGAEARRHSEDDGNGENMPITKKRDRNLSISRSGRHKLKGRTRISLLQNEIFSQDRTGSSGPSQTSSTPSSTAPTATTSCRDMGSSLSDSQPRHLASQPTAV